MEVKSRSRKSRRRRDFPVKVVFLAAVSLLVVVAAILGLYIYKGQKYKEAFFENTTINGVDASGKTVEEVKASIAAAIDGYTLTLEERGGKTEQITGEEIKLHSEFNGSLEKILEAQDPLKWWIHWKTPESFQIETMISFDEALLKEKVDALQCFDEAHIQEPMNAYLSDYISGQGYTIVPEEQGNHPVKETVEAGIAEGIRNLKSKVSFEDLGAYVKPEIISTNEELVKVRDSLNKQAGVTVTYTFGDQTEVLSGETTHNWLSVNADKTIGLDRDQVAAYVKSLASKYNTAYKNKTLNTSYSQTVTISGGPYGWRINQSAETDELYNIIRSGESQTREPIYSQTAASHGPNDYGNTYVEINLTAQHLFFYKDGKLLAETDFVSGSHAKGFDTPPGAYPLTYKERDAILKGEGYSSPVDYWMPFNGNIGMHDASWRSSFGGNIYKSNGSHGCINLPPSMAKTIYDNVYKGMPVLCYNLEGTESKTTTSKPKETTAAAVTAAVPVETTPAETAPPETVPPETVPPETSGAGTGTTGAPSGPGTTPTVPVGPGVTPPSTAAESSPVETTAAPVQTAPETSKVPNGPGDMGAGSTSVKGNTGPGV